VFQSWAAIAHAQAPESAWRSLRAPFGVEQLVQQAGGASLAERQRAQQRLSALGSAQAVQQLNIALLRLLPGASKNTAELRGLILALAPHAADPETRTSLLRVVLGSTGPQAETIDPELRQMAALAIAAQRTPAAVQALRHALLADRESAELASTALRAHPPKEVGQLLGAMHQRSGADHASGRDRPSDARPSDARPSDADKTVTKTNQRTAQGQAAWDRVACEGERLPTAQLLGIVATAPEAAPLAVCQLAARDEPDQRSSLLSWLDSPQLAIRMRAALGLGASEHADATGLLLHAVDDSAWQVRWAALSSLAQRHDATSRRALQVATALEPNTEARTRARQLLAAGKFEPATQCPVRLPLPDLNAADATPIAVAGELPEARRSPVTR
jgi:HEAT repeat protein